MQEQIIEKERLEKERADKEKAEQIERQQQIESMLSQINSKSQSMTLPSTAIKSKSRSDKQ